MSSAPVALSSLPAIVPNGAAILFPDTCSVLDLLRFPGRVSVTQLTREVSTIQRLVSLPPERLIIIIAPPIHDEFSKNLQSVYQEQNTLATNWCSQGSRYESAMKLYPISASWEPPRRLEIDELLRHASSLAMKLLDKAIHIQAEDSLKLKAFARVTARTAPARKGGQHNDCLIVEHVLAAAHILKGNQNRLLLTSNTKDFGKCGSMKPTLDAEFRTASLQFSNEWTHAAQLLGV